MGKMKTGCIFSLGVARYEATNVTREQVGYATRRMVQVIGLLFPIEYPYKNTWAAISYWLWWHNFTLRTKNLWGK